MPIEAAGSNGLPISTRNGVPPPDWVASDPPGGVPSIPDPMQQPHPAPDEGMPVPEPAVQVELPNEPPLQPPHREAAKRSHHKAK